LFRIAFQCIPDSLVFVKPENSFPSPSMRIRWKAVFE
jgi:hypothetical protein